MRIWNNSIESQEEISDSAIITLLQGPLRLPRETDPLVDLARQVSSTNKPIETRYSSSLFLLCYYFMFRQDPYGRPITKATISSPLLKGHRPLYEYIGRYWDAKEWLRLLSKCADLDFHKVAQREQDKHSLHSPGSIWDTGQNSKRIARISSKDDIYFNVWIGPLKDWEAVLEFEEGSQLEYLDTENPIEPVSKSAERDEAPLPSTICSTGQKSNLFKSVRHMKGSYWFHWILLSVALHYMYFIYSHILTK
jgi:hypothetical protein